MPIRVLLAFLFFLGLITLSIFYLAKRSMSLCPALGRQHNKVWGFFLVFLLLMLLVPLINRLSQHHLNFLYWPSFLLFSLVSTFLLYLLAADLLQFVSRRFLFAPTAVRGWAFHAAFWASAVSVCLGLWTALKPPQLQAVDIPIEDLPEALNGFRIVQISDLHLAPLVTEKSVSRLAEQIKAQAPDMIAITGDLVDGEADGVRHKAQILKDLPSTHGTFFVTGNHENYSGLAKWLPLFHSFGWHVLDNQAVILNHAGAPLAVAGMPDPHTKRSFPNLQRALAQVPSSTTKILLFHPPNGYVEAESAGVALQLSGHTHSGQYFPWSLIIPHFFQYPRGLNRHGKMWLYTSVGTGFWGPPNRLLVPPELTLLTLRAK